VYASEPETGHIHAVVDFVHDLEDMHDRIEPGYLKTRPKR
jgi:hypothetical protein